MRYLTVLFADAPRDTFIELRFRTESGMGRAFYAVDDVHAVSSMIANLAEHTDVYVGVLPRRRQASTCDDLVPTGSVLWVDCDNPASAATLRDFSPAPSLVVASGTNANRHAYWMLHLSISLDAIETANRHLACIIGADMSCSDGARILRPPSQNHKCDPPTAVRLLQCDTSARYRIDEVVGVIYDDKSTVRNHLSGRLGSADPLLRLAPAVYIERLTGLHVPRHGKVRCPFHQDDTPSLHVYRESHRGWYCYGCGRGGSIYDFAALLWGTGTRGVSFVQLRRALTTIFAA
jgi:hypothetical protein